MSVRMDLSQWEVAEREPDGRCLLHLLNLAVGLARVRTLVVAVLENHGALRTAANVIDLRIERLQHRPS